MRRKKRAFAAEIAEIEAQIKKAEMRVKELKGQLKDIQKERDMEVHQAIATVMNEKKLDINDVLQLVKDAPVPKTPEAKVEKKTRKKKKK